eukprot:CAMPEP_0197843236 /NCGR_PEP_ID=MMETSP1438-20131217/62_1 /TAXON_ID=1461541 /ORGANISM="Pterosperma sp., Strain CCMP1384" /LENGTH=436 /DNA_ID=CAMNT_0043453241 /DNA_START=630 /DNA_END=1940 /DNA_ORIENTATION=-
MVMAPILARPRPGGVADYYHIGKTIGRGGFSVVKRAICRANNQAVAIKILDLPTEETEVSDQYCKQIYNEISILCQIRHESIVHMFEYFVDGNRVYLVTELLTGGEMLDAVLACGKYCESDGRKLFMQLMSCLNYMHGKNIAHRDLKLENLLMKNPNDLESLKLADYGLSRSFDRDSMSTICGSPIYVAPEVIKLLEDPNSAKYGQECDMWSAGVILYILLCGFQPFDSENEQDLFNLIQTGEYSLEDPVWNNVSDEAKDLIANLLCIHPAKRMTAADALKHPWFRKEMGVQAPPLSHVHARLRDLVNKMAYPRVTVQPGEFLIRQGDIGDEVFFIRSGNVEVLACTASEDFPGHVIAHRGPGDYVGEMSTMISNSIRQASVRASTVMEVQVLNGMAMKALSCENDEFHQELNRTMEKRAAEMIVNYRQLPTFNAQ